MITGQKVRVRPGSVIARDWKISSDVQGTVLCRYRVLTARSGTPDRVDVRFPGSTIWGGPADQFENVGENP
jgi:hypothetical protein